MRNITVSVDDDTYRRSRIRAAELDTSVSALVLRHRELDEVLADFDARGVGLRSCDNLTRDELYDEATGKSDALR